MLQHHMLPEIRTLCVKYRLRSLLRKISMRCMTITIVLCFKRRNQRRMELISEGNSIQCFQNKGKCSVQMFFSCFFLRKNPFDSISTVLLHRFQQLLYAAVKLQILRMPQMYFRRHSTGETPCIPVSEFTILVDTNQPMLF